MSTETEVLQGIREAMNDPNVRVALPYVFGQGVAAQVYVKSRKVGPLIIPDRAGGQSLADVLHMLGEMAEAAP